MARGFAGGRPRRYPKSATITDTISRDETPLAYMLRIVNDPKADAMRRDRLAIAAAPYCHPRISDMRVTQKQLRAGRVKAVLDHSEWSDLLRDGDEPAN
jgi:hypothetical protein